MSKVRIFVSFEFDKDKKLRGDFYGQANRGDSHHYILDSSLREDYPKAEWLDEARALIRRCDIVVVLVGQDTHSAPGVEKEVTVTRQLKKPIFQIRNQRSTWSKVRGAGELIDWEWNKIDTKIRNLLHLK